MNLWMMIKYMDQDSLFGRNPIRNTTHIHYESCFGYLDNASDCFASKGLRGEYLEIDVDGVIFHFYNTHLEAGNGPEDHNIRAEQVHTILATSIDIRMMFLWF